MAMNSKQFILWVEKEFPELTSGLRGYFDENGIYPSEWSENIIIEYEKAKGQLLKEEYKKKYKDDKVRKIVTEVAMSKFKYTRRFVKMFTVSIDSLSLDVVEEGLISKLQRYLLTDGSGRVSITGVSSITAMSKFFNINRRTLVSKLETLEEKNVINITKISKDTIIHLNPKYVMYGEKFNDNLIEMFGINKEELI